MMAEKPRLRESPPLSSVLPPLIFGTATFNSQYNKDPYALNTQGLVEEALRHGVRAFDTSPYYGPAEELLGAALNTEFTRERFPRNDYFLLTKVGRVSGDEFDYSPAWVRQSVKQSLKRLQTDRLDVVYCHDAEFVSAGEVLEAVKELRRIRDEDGTISYIGISGYPVGVLCTLADRVRDETGEPLDIVQSYAKFTLQNTTLLTHGLPRLQAAGVDVVANASMLGMGLLRQEGVPVGALGDWHPAPTELRASVHQAALFCERYDERLEVVALRWALESWLSAGSSVGSSGDPASGVPWTPESNRACLGGRRLGVSVIGVSHGSELSKTLRVWRSILDGQEHDNSVGARIAAEAGRWARAHEWSLHRRKAVGMIAEEVQERLGAWRDYAWPSPPEGWNNKMKVRTWPSPEASPEPEVASIETRPAAGGEGGATELR